MYVHYSSLKAIQVQALNGLCGRRSTTRGARLHARMRSQHLIYCTVPRILFRTEHPITDRHECIIQNTTVVNSRSEFGMSSFVSLSQSLDWGRGGFWTLYDGVHVTSALYCAGLLGPNTSPYRDAEGFQRCDLSQTAMFFTFAPSGFAQTRAPTRNRGRNASRARRGYLSDGATYPAHGR